MNNVENTGSALFATHLYARPNEATDYEVMRGKLLLELRPAGAFEESLALQIINANWRLRRCDAAERSIPVLSLDADGAIHDFAHPAQAAISRARTAAENTIRRTAKDLKELQSERWRRATLKLTGPIEPQELGLAPIREAMSPIPATDQRSRLLDRHLALQRTSGDPNAGLQNEPNSPPATPAVPIRAPQTPGRNATCPCNSGQKYKRCCGHWSKAA